MKRISIGSGIFALLAFEAAVISIVMIVSVSILSRAYTGLIYNETTEVLNLHTMIINSRMAEMEKLSFEILSDTDIQRNLLAHKNASAPYQAYVASSDLYSQLFTRWATDRRLLFIEFQFEDGERVQTSNRGDATISEATRADLASKAHAADGACVWAANAAGDMTVVLCRLIKDTSGNGFRPLGVLYVAIDGRQLLAYPSVVPENRKPDMFCVAGNQVITQSTLAVRRAEIEGSLRHPFQYDIVPYGGQRYFIAVRQAAPEGWYFVYMLSTNKLLGTITHINVAFVLAVLVALAGVVAIGYRFARTISSPIAHLARTMKVVSGGDYRIPEEATTAGTAISEVKLLSEDFVDMVGKIDHLINEVYAEKLLSAEMKYKVLQHQINPHFLYNTLDTINWKAIQSGNADISAMVRSLSQMLRRSVKGPDAVTVEDDLEFVRNYIVIQMYRFEERLAFTSSIQPEVLKCGIPRMALQPIVENCIMHNLEKHSGSYEIRIASSHTEDGVEIAVDDNGHGVDLTRMERILGGREDPSDGSIGIRNINERIKMLFGGGFGLRVLNREPAGTRVIVMLPFRELR